MKVDIKIGANDLALFLGITREDIYQVYPNAPEDHQFTIHEALRISYRFNNDFINYRRELLFKVMDESLDAVREMLEIVGADGKPAPRSSADTEQTFGSAFRKIVNAGKPPKK